MKCAACAANGPGTVHERKKPAAYSKALVEYSVADNDARRDTSGSERRYRVAISGAPTTPKDGIPSMAVRRNEPRDKRAAVA